MAVQRTSNIHGICNSMQLSSFRKSHASCDHHSVDVLVLAWEYPPYITGGLGVACKELCEALSLQAQIGIKIIHPKGSKYTFNTDVSLSESSYSNSDSIVNRTLAYASSVVEYCVNQRYSVVHAHDWLTFTAAMKLKKKFDIPFVAHVHSLEIDRSPCGPNPKIVRIEQEAFAVSDVIVAVSEYTKERIVNIFGVDPRKVEVVYNGVTSKFESESEKLPLEKRTRRVSFVGRLTAQKGPDIFLRAAEAILNLDFDIEFTIVGCGDMLDCLKKRAGNFLGDRVRFLGFLEHERVAEVLKDSLVLVMPSRSEPFGIVGLEAIQLGTPVLASTSVGFVEKVPEVKTFSLDSLSDIVDSIRYIIDNIPMAEEMAGRAKKQIEDLTWSASAKKMEDIFFRITRENQMLLGAISVEARVVS